MPSDAPTFALANDERPASSLRPAPAANDRPQVGGLFFPCLIVFFSGFCVMVVELVANRLVSRYIGSSLYTWTTVIGAILAGVSLGNYLGGRLVDRFNAKALVMILFLVAGGLCLSILPVSEFLGQWTASWVSNANEWTARILVVIFGTFLLPGTAIGMISPAIAKWALDQGRATGATVGSVYSWNTLGSIVGTFVTGFFLVAWFDIDVIVAASGVALALAGVLFLPGVLWDAATRRGRQPVSTVRELPSTDVAEGLFLPCFLVFLSGFAVMLVEMVASRLTADHIGQSLFTWTSVIGVVLAGISVGNRIGGALADEFEPRSLVSTLFLFASLTTLTALSSHRIIGNATQEWMGQNWLDVDRWLDPSATWAIRVFIVVFAAFIIPSTALGTISPAVAKWALDQGRATGRTVGTIYSWNTIGSILGTFMTGFFLISTFYVSRLLTTTSLVLALVAFLMSWRGGSWGTRLASLITLPIAGLFFFFAVLPAHHFESAVLAAYPAPSRDEKGDQLPRSEREKEERSHLRFLAEVVGRSDEINIWDQYNFRDDFEYYDESNYYMIQVSEETLRSNLRNDVETDSAGKAVLDEDGSPKPRRRQLRKLVLDALVHGYLDMNDYKYLHYEYEHLYATVSHRLLKKHQAEKQPLRTLFLGGGSYTFPRYLSEYYPDIPCDIAEIDPRVTLTVRRAMGLNEIHGKRKDGKFGKRFVVVGPVSQKELDRLSDELEKQKAGDAKSRSDDKAADGDDKAADGDNKESVEKFPVKLPQSLSALLTQLPKRGSDVVRALTEPSTPLDMRTYYEKLILGAGGILLPEYSKAVDIVLDLRPANDEPSDVIDKAKKDATPIVTPAELVNMLEVTSHQNIVTHHMDARQFVIQNKDRGAYDIVYGDAFNDFSVPAHLTTVEFNQQMATLLKPDGIFMANVIDIWSKSRFMGPYMNTLKKVFKHVYLLSTDDGKPGHERATFVIICSQSPVKLDDLGKREEDKGLTSTVLSGKLLAPVVRGGLFPIGKETMVSDGETKEFTLKKQAKDVGIISLSGTTRKVGSVRYETPDPTTLTFKIPPTRGHRIWVSTNGDLEKAIILATGDGSTKEFKLPTPVPKGSDLAVAIDDNKPVPLDDEDYRLVDGKTIRFNNPPTKGARFIVTLYGDKEIILTDRYSPVDNLLGEVAATRAE